MKRKYLAIVLAAAVSTACTTTDPHTGEKKASNTAKGAGIGAAAGAVLGAIINHDDRAKGAAVGAALGGGAGAAVGYRKDKQEAELREKLAASGVNVQAEGDAIKLVLPGNISFDSGRSSLRADFYPELSKVAASLQQYPNTRVVVVGHTDNQGGDELNQRLSQARAESVVSYLIAQGVEPSRLQATGVGASQPVASNAVAVGRAENRRVEIKILAPTQAASI